MNDEAAFLSAIRAAPADAAAKLVFADWLDEGDRHVDAAIVRVLARPERDELRLAFADACGAEVCRLTRDKFLVVPETGLGQHVAHLDTRAALTRVQVELARMEPDTAANCSPSWGDLCRREAALLAGAAKAKLRLAGACLDYWLRAGEPLDTRRPNNLVATFRRGFVDTVIGPPALWVERGDEILLTHPVRRVRLTTRPEMIERARRADGTSRWEFGFSTCAPWIDAPTASTPEELFALRWPGIVFERPGAGAYHP